MIRGYEAPRLLSDGAKLENTKPRGSEPPLIQVATKQASWDRAVAGFDVTEKAATAELRVGNRLEKASDRILSILYAEHG